MFIYNDNEPKQVRRGVVKYENLNAPKHWLTHYSNHKFLSFILSNSQDRNERHQANKEIAIAERKMTWWKRHPNWRVEAVEQEKRRIDLQWASKRYEQS